MRLIVFVLVVVLAVLPAQAQTSTPAPTETPTVTPTPDVYLYWELPTEEATSEPGAPQGVAFAYQIDAGDTLIMLLIAAITFWLWAAFLIFVLRNRRR